MIAEPKYKLYVPVCLKTANDHKRPQTTANKYRDDRKRTQTTTNKYKNYHKQLSDTTNDRKPV